MQKHGAATSSDSRGGVVVNLDNEIVQVVVAPEAIAAAIAPEFYVLIVVPVGGVLAPRILRTDRADRQEGPWSRVTVCAPPEADRPEDTPRGPAIALALVGQDAAASERDRDRVTSSRQPAPTAISGSGTDPDLRNRPSSRF